MTTGNIDELVDLVRQAGKAILEIYATDFDVETKSDESPVTAADLAAHAVLAAGLADLTPEIPLVSEESELPTFSERRAWPRYWLIDPLDGTKEFVSKNGEFTVNVALIDDHRAVLGLVGVPVQDKVYVGDVIDARAYRIDGDVSTPLATRTLTNERLTVVASRRHGGDRLEGFLDGLSGRFATIDRRPIGSSLKFCLLAEGEADFYPRLGPTSEWDIAAADAVLTAAGGSVRWADGSPVCYNAKESFLNGDFVAMGDPSYDWDSVLADLPPAGA